MYPTNLQAVAESNILKYSDRYFDFMVGSHSLEYSLDYLYDLNSNISTEIQYFKKIVSETKDLYFEIGNLITSKQSFILIQSNNDLKFELYTLFFKSTRSKIIAVDKYLFTTGGGIYEYDCYFVNDTYMKYDMDSFLSTLIESGIYFSWVEASIDAEHLVLRSGFPKTLNLALQSTNFTNEQKNLFRTYLEIFDADYKPEPLTFNTVEQVLYLCIVFICISVAMFCLEVVVYIFVIVRIITRGYL